MLSTEMETSAGGTSIFKVCKIQGHLSLSLRSLISSYFCQIQPMYYIQEYKTLQPNSSCGLALLIVWLCCGSTTSSPFPPLQSTQLRAIPIGDALVHTSLFCSDAACFTSLPNSTYLANVDEIDFGCRVCAAAIAFEQR